MELTGLQICHYHLGARYQWSPGLDRFWRQKEDLHNISQTVIMLWLIDYRRYSAAYKAVYSDVTVILEVKSNFKYIVAEYFYSVVLLV